MQEAMQKETPIFANRTPQEEKLGACLPGDDCYPYDNQYMNMNPQRVASLIRGGSLSPEENEKAIFAIRAFSTVTGDGVMATKFSPPDIPQEPRVYREPESSAYEQAASSRAIERWKKAKPIR